MTLIKPTEDKKESSTNKKERIQVVKEIPVQEIRSIENKETGEITHLITTEEALTLILNQK